MRFFFYIILFALPVFMRAQTQPVTILVKGKLFSDLKVDYGKVMIIAKQAGVGIFADVDGTFNVSLKKTDTLIVNYSGFATKRYSFKDSVQKAEYYIEVKMELPLYSLKEITVYPMKSLAEIQKNINKIKVKKQNPYKDIADALESPITALYNRFSRMEQSKRIVAELENEDLKRQALKDLFRLYIKYDIISLNDTQFDDFITYCNLPDQFIVSASEYELVEAIKARYKKYQEVNDYYREK